MSAAHSPHTVIALTRGDARLDAVERLFLEMYDELEGMGLRGRLIEGGHALWRRSVEPTLGKHAAVFVSQTGNDVTGFVHGMVRFQPSFIVGPKVGYITHLYVAPAHRRGGVARQLVASVEEWFAARAIEVIQLQVLAGNRGGDEFWRSNGFLDESTQLEKALPAARGSQRSR